MIIIARRDVTEGELDVLRQRIEAAGLRARLLRGGERVSLVCVGEGAPFLSAEMAACDGVERVLPVAVPYPLAFRASAGCSSVVALGGAHGAVIGGRALTVIADARGAGDAAALPETARALGRAGAGALLGAASDPAAVEGLARVRPGTGLPVVVEVLDTRRVERAVEVADALHVRAGDMQNFALLQEVGRARRPVVLERGASATVEELLLAAEHVMAHGGDEVVLCERGIRTFGGNAADTLDLSVIPVLKAETHLPVLVDPGRASGRPELVAPLAFAAVAAGADGLVVGVHAEPREERHEPGPALSLSAFARLMERLEPFCAAAGRTPPAAPPAPEAGPEVESGNGAVARRPAGVAA